MARNSGAQIENNFIRGLVTEATGLNFPENACTDTTNCIFDRTGYVYRRFGIDYEVGADATNLVGRDNSVFSEFTWQAVGGQGDLTFSVVQVGSTVYFWEPTATGSLSAGMKSFSINLNNYRVSGAPDTKSLSAQFASGKGYLFIVHPNIDPLYVNYNPASGGSITVTKITIQTRDFKGVEDGLDIEDRLSSITNPHRYNLQNQGWYGTANFATNEDNANQGNGQKINEWRNRTGRYPSNADVWWMFTNNNKTIITNWVGRIELGNTPASKGHYILNEFYQDRSGASGVTGIPVVTAGSNRPASVAFFAGRAFYSAVAGADFSSKIYFSQIIERDEQLGYAYQLNDPTTQYETDLLPSDGGVIVIPEMGTVYRMVPVDASLVVFAANGIWSISGSQGTGFSANDYAVKKLAGVETKSSTSFVIANGLPVWWNQDGIYAVTVDQSLGTLSVTSVVDKTIQDFYDDIPNQSKNYAKGAYNPLTRRVQWLYRSTVATDIDDRYNYDSVLNFDTTTGSFYPWSISQISNGPRVNGILVSSGSSTTRTQEAVTTIAGVTVTTNAGVEITSNTELVVQLSASYRYITTKLASPSALSYITFSQERNVNYLDWVTPNFPGVSFTSQFTTGYKVHGDGVRKFQSNYLSMYSEVESESSFYVQGHWNFAINGNGGNWSTKQQGYRPSTTQRYTWSRLKIRGEGNVLQFRVTSQDGRPFSIIGYAVFETSNGAP